MEEFAKYAFNKSHAAYYGLVSYWTAYLKVNYPSEFLACKMTSLLDKKDKLLVIIDDCRKHNIPVLPPDVNESNHEFTVVDGGIRFGLQAIKGIGETPINAIDEARKEGGRFVSLFDFCERVPARACGKSAIETLIKCGAFDSIHANRQAMLDATPGAVEAGQKTMADALSGQINMFGETTEMGRPKSMGQLPDVPDADRDERLLWEKDLVGLYLSDHPLLPLRGFLEQETESCLRVNGERAFNDQARVTMGGLATQIQRRVDKNGRTWASLTLEDLTGSIDVLVFAKAYDKASELVREDAKILVTGRLSADSRRGKGAEDDDETVFKLMADSLEEINVAEASEVPSSDLPMGTSTEIERIGGTEFEVQSPETMSGEAAAAYAMGAPMPSSSVGGDGGFNGNGGNGNGGNGNGGGDNGGNSHAANGGMTLHRSHAGPPNSNYGPGGNGAAGALQNNYANGHAGGNANANGHPAPPTGGYGEEETPRIARGFYPPPTASECVHLHFIEGMANAATISRIWNICRAHHGDVPVWLHIDNGLETMQMKVSDSYNVDGSVGFCIAVREVLGSDCVVQPCLPYG